LHDATPLAKRFPTLGRETTAATDYTVAQRYVSEERKPHMCNDYPVLSFLIFIYFRTSFQTSEVPFLQTVFLNYPKVNQLQAQGSATGHTATHFQYFRKTALEMPENKVNTAPILTSAQSTEWYIPPPSNIQPI
jgi:uncharacterized membrane protein